LWRERHGRRRAWRDARPYAAHPYRYSRIFGCVTLSISRVKQAEDAARQPDFGTIAKNQYARFLYRIFMPGGGNPHRPFTRPCAIEGARATREGNRVLDILFLAVALAFFGLSAAAVRAFDRL